MKTFLTSTTEHLAAVLAHFRNTVRANQPRPEGFEYRPRTHAPLPADPSRIPAYLRRRGDASGAFSRRATRPTRRESAQSPAAWSSRRRIQHAARAG
jgi:hypothetical protein